jgi:hypothetical protein
MTVPLGSALLCALALVALGAFGAMRGGGPVRSLVALEVLAGGIVLALPALARSVSPLRLADPSAPHSLALLVAVAAGCQAATLLGCSREAPRDPRAPSGDDGRGRGPDGEEDGARGVGPRAILCVLGALVVLAIALWASG